MLKKDTTAFLKGLQQERDRASNMACFVTSTYEFVDATPVKRIKGLEDRLRLLKRVDEHMVMDLRNTLIGFLEAEIKTR